MKRVIRLRVRSLHNQSRPKLGGPNMTRATSPLLAAILLISAPASAQEVEESEKIVDTKFILVTGSLVVSTIFDIETTFAAINNSDVPVYEGNPIMRPFINSGRPATYAFVGLVDAGIVYISYRMKKSADPDIQKFWWVMPMAATTGHTLAGGLNLRFVF